MKYIVCCLLLVSQLSFAQLSKAEKKEIDSAIPKKAFVDVKSPKKMLVFTLNRKEGKPNYGHPSIEFANYALTQMGEKTGAFECVISKDSLMFTKENLAQFDVICFNNTAGVVFDSPELRQNLLDFVENGGGFVGIHAAAATFCQWPEYGQFPEFGKMLGAYENGGHPWKPHEWIILKVEEDDHPLTSMFAKTFPVSDEVFQFREHYTRDKLRILLTIDPTQTNMSKERYILPERRADLDLAVSWIRKYGQGRVFYSALGHNTHIFSNPQILQHYLAGIQYAAGDLKADATPSNKIQSK